MYTSTDHLSELLAFPREGSIVKRMLICVQVGLLHICDIGLVERLKLWKKRRLIRGIGGKDQAVPAVQRAERPGCEILR